MSDQARHTVIVCPTTPREACAPSRPMR